MIAQPWAFWPGLALVAFGIAAFIYLAVRGPHTRRSAHRLTRATARRSRIQLRRKP